MFAAAHVPENVRGAAISALAGLPARVKLVDDECTTAASHDHRTVLELQRLQRILDLHRVLLSNDENGYGPTGIPTGAGLGNTCRQASAAIQSPYLAAKRAGLPPVCTKTIAPPPAPARPDRTREMRAARALPV